MVVMIRTIKQQLWTAIDWPRRTPDRAPRTADALPACTRPATAASEQYYCFKSKALLFNNRCYYILRLLRTVRSVYLIINQDRQSLGRRAAGEDLMVMFQGFFKCLGEKTFNFNVILIFKM